MSGRRLTSMLGLSVATIAALRAIREPPGAPVGSWSDLERWYDAVGPATAVVASVRMAAIVGAAWLAVAISLQLLAGLLRGRWLARVADGISPRFLRGAAGLSLSVGLALPSAPTGPPGDGPGTAVMVPLDVVATSTTPPPPTSTSTTSTTTPSTSTSTTPSTIPPPPNRPTPGAPPPAPTAPAVAPPRVPDRRADEVVVLPGDSFWSIAEAEVGTRDVTTYWLELIERNRDRLVDPANPDLLYPDQVLRLP